MLTIRRETDYAARVILHLALREPGARIPARVIAEERLIPAALVRRVVTRLAAARLVITTRGPDGGISLARPPAEISLLEVVEAMEGPVALNTCVLDEETCPLIDTCTVHCAWLQARKTLRETLEQFTYDKLANTP